MCVFFTYRGQELTVQISQAVVLNAVLAPCLFFFFCFFFSPWCSYLSALWITVTLKSPDAVAIFTPELFGVLRAELGRTMRRRKRNAPAGLSCLLCWLLPKVLLYLLICAGKTLSLKKKKKKELNFCLESWTPGPCRKKNFQVGNPWPSLLQAVWQQGRAEEPGRRPGWAHWVPPAMQRMSPWALAWRLKLHHGMTRLRERREQGFGSAGSDAFLGAIIFSEWLGVPLCWRSSCETSTREVKDLHPSIP